MLVQRNVSLAPTYAPISQPSQSFNRVSQALNNQIHQPLNQSIDRVHFQQRTGSLPAAPTVQFTATTPQPPAIPFITQTLARIKVVQPNGLQNFFNRIKSIVTVVDPQEALKESVVNLFKNKTQALALVQAYSHPQGQFQSERLQQDLRQLLPYTNPGLTGVELEKTVQIMASKAQNTAINLVTQGSFPPAGKLPTRPITVAATPYPQKDILIDGMRLRYIDVAPPNPKGTLLMVHGHQSSVEEFNDLMPYLSQHYRVVAFDLPGSGYSEQPKRDFTLEFYEDTILHFMDKLGIQQATIAGGSLGGNMSLRMGRKAPERFPTVISWSPAGVWPSKKLLSTVANTPLLETPLYWTMLRYQSPHWYRDGHPNKEEMIAESMTYHREVDSQIFRRSTRQIAAQQLRDTHRGQGHLNKQPTLLLVGEEDKGLDLAQHAIEFSKELPNKELVIYPQTGHSIHNERPADLAQRMMAFIEKQKTTR